MKKISRLICALLCAALLLSASAFAAEDGFNASLTIDRSAAGQIRVTVADSSVLAAKKPTLTIPCEFAAAYVSFGGSVIASALDTEKKEISFPVAAGGTYVIQSGAAPSAPAAEVTVPVFSAAGKVDASATVTAGTASVHVTDGQLRDIVSAPAAEAGAVEVDVSGLDGVTAAAIPAGLVDAAAKAAGGRGLEVRTRNGSVAFDGAALGAADTGGTVVVSVAPVAHEKLGETQRNAVPADALIVDVSVLVNGVRVHDFSGGSITVSLPYTLKAGERPDCIAVWYLEDDGSLTPMNGKYDPASGMVVFITAHLSQYVIGSFPFSDVPGGAYYYDAVRWAVGKSVADGMSATAFTPAGVCTRAQAVTFLWRAMGSPEPTETVCPFADVNAGAWYYKAVLWATEKGITLGVNDTAFAPDDAVTRAQAVTFLHRAAARPAPAAANPFADVAAGTYYQGAVAWAAAQKIAQGAGSTTFSPAAPCTRAHMVTFLWRWLGK